jgi:hypothetical protein
MTTYYWETDRSSRGGQFEAENDQQAIARMQRIMNARLNDTLLCLYKESDTANGRPFIVVLDKTDHL